MQNQLLTSSDFDESSLYIYRVNVNSVIFRRQLFQLLPIGGTVGGLKDIDLLLGVFHQQLLLLGLSGFDYLAALNQSHFFASLQHPGESSRAFRIIRVPEATMLRHRAIEHQPRAYTLHLVRVQCLLINVLDVVAVRLFVVVGLQFLGCLFRCHQCSWRLYLQ